MVKILTQILLSLFLVVFIAETAHAQRPGEVAAWRADFERLKHLAETAREVLAAYPHDQAQKHLAEAEAMIQKIDAKIAAQDYSFIAQLIRNAIMQVETALKLALNPALQRSYNRLQELMQRTESEVLGSGNREAIRLAQEARKHKLQGEQIGRMQPFQAIQQFQIAINLLERALRLVGHNPGGDGSPAELAQRAREYFQDLERQLQERLPHCDRVAAQRLLEQARRLFLLAEEAFRKGDYATAQKLYNNAVRLMLRALDLCPVQSQDAGQFQAEAAKLRDMLAAAEERLNAGNEPRDRALLDWARKMLLEAETAWLAQRPLEAFRGLERARRLIERVLRNRSQKPVDYQEQCEAALQQLRVDLAEVEAEVVAAKRADAQSLLELAQKAASEAEKICARKPHTLLSLAAFRASLRLGHQLLLQIETLLQEGQAPAQDRAAVQQRLQQLDATMSEVRGNLAEGQKEHARALFEQAATLRERAHAALERGQSYLSAELCNLAFDLLREILKLGND